MIFFYSFLIFLFGASLGSFANVCIYRLPRDKQIISGRSYCPECKKKISWYDNLPLISYIFLNGKCRNCDKSISVRYFIVELITGISYFELDKVEEARSNLLLATNFEDTKDTAEGWLSYINQF